MHKRNLFLLAQHLQLLSHLDLALALELFLFATTILTMFLAKDVQSVACVLQLGQLVLKCLIMSWWWWGIKAWIQPQLDTDEQDKKNQHWYAALTVLILSNSNLFVVWIHYNQICNTITHVKKLISIKLLNAMCSVRENFEFNHRESCRTSSLLLFLNVLH